jgi:predicted nucleic acid-binding protein
LQNSWKNLALATFQHETPIPENYARSAQIIRQYDDANIDFVDALIVAIAERFEITKFLTADQLHFQMFRPVHCNLLKSCFRISPPKFKPNATLVFIV